MLKYADYDIVFTEIPDEVTLAINLSNCPHRCKGCHSPYLQQDVGYELNEDSLTKLIANYKNSITCVCFMGGDADIDGLCYLAHYVKQTYNGKIKTGWYSGNNSIKNIKAVENFDFIKLGEYVEALGGLNKKTTNQRLYSVDKKELNDITALLQK